MLAMNLHLAEIAETVARSPRRPPRPSGRMAFVGKTGRSHQHHILLLPPKSPELNPVENIWQFMRDNWLSNRVFSPSRWPWPWAAQTHTADSRFVGTADLLAARRFQRGDDIILHAEGPPCTDLTGFPANGGFYFQQTGRSSFPSLDMTYNSDWTPHWRDFHPLEGAASLGALARPKGRPRLQH